MDAVAPRLRFRSFGNRLRMPDDLPESPQSAADAQRQTVVLLAILVEGGLLAGASFLGWMIGHSPRFNWNLPAVGWGIAATVPLMILFFVFVRWPIGPLRRIHRFSEKVIRPLLAPCTVLDLFGISILAGLGEEVFFRGVMQDAVSDWFKEPAGVWVGVIATSLLFGMMHSITFTYALLATVMGAYLSCVCLWTEGNLLVVVITHALYDFLVLLWLLRGPGAAEAIAKWEADAASEKSSESPPSE